MNEYNIDMHVSVFGKKLRCASSLYIKYVSRGNTSEWLRIVAIKRRINEWIYRYGQAILVILQQLSLRLSSNKHSLVISATRITTVLDYSGAAISIIIYYLFYLVRYF